MPALLVSLLSSAPAANLVARQPAVVSVGADPPGPFRLTVPGCGRSEYLRLTLDPHGARLHCLSQSVGAWVLTGLLPPSLCDRLASLRWGDLATRIDLAASQWLRLADHAVRIDAEHGHFIHVVATAPEGVALSARSLIAIPNGLLRVDLADERSARTAPSFTPCDRSAAPPTIPPGVDLDTLCATLAQAASRVGCAVYREGDPTPIAGAIAPGSWIVADESDHRGIDAPTGPGDRAFFLHQGQDGLTPFTQLTVHHLGGRFSLRFPLWEGSVGEGFAPFSAPLLTAPLLAALRQRAPVRPVAEALAPWFENEQRSPATTDPLRRLGLNALDAPLYVTPWLDAVSITDAGKLPECHLRGAALIHAALQATRDAPGRFVPLALVGALGLLHDRRAPTPWGEWSSAWIACVLSLPDGPIALPSAAWIEGTLAALVAPALAASDVAQIAVDTERALRTWRNDQAIRALRHVAWLHARLAPSWIRQGRREILLPDRSVVGVASGPRGTSGGPLIPRAALDALRRVQATDILSASVVQWSDLQRSDEEDEHAWRHRRAAVAAHLRATSVTYPKVVDAIEPAVNLRSTLPVRNK